MADFTSSQRELDAARRALDQAQLTLLQATARAQQAQAALDSARRQQTPQQEGGSFAQLEAAAKQAAAQRDTAKAARQRVFSSLATVSSQFAEFSDPRKNVEQLGDSSPFLLFPVRIETRFRTLLPQSTPGTPVPAPRHQLWVRIYPDDCSIDTFEPMFSQAELTNTKNYWLNVWRAGGVENDDRGAWRNLVAAHGSGRAGWLADNFHPANLAAKPSKVDVSDEILVIPTNPAPNAADAAAISHYWQAVWLADGEASKLQAARAALEAAVGAARADDLVAAYGPFNLADAPAAPLTKTD